MALLDRFMQRLTSTAHGLQDWPPKSVRDEWAEIEGYRLRFENDRASLIQINPRWHGSAEELFTPVPVAYEMARISSSLLFSEEIRVEHQLQDALDEIVEDSDFDEFCHETGEYAANQGVVGIKIGWDPDTSDLPIITWVHGDQVLWDVRHSRYVQGGAVVTERIPEDRPGAPVFRLIEEHGRGYVERTLYKGSGTKLGQPVSLKTLDEFKHIPPRELTGLDEPTLIQWKNVPGGRSDLFPVLGLLDRIDEAESLLLEKARKSRPWLFTTSDFAKDGVVDITNLILLQGSEAQEYLGIGEGGRLVEHVQGAMQSEEHIAWSFHILDLALMMSGYSLATWARDPTGGQADSGKALKLRQARTLLNRAAKDRMSRRSLAKALAIALAMRENPGATEPGQVAIKDYLPEITLGDGMPEDPLETAQEIQTLDSAGAISLEQKVKLQHPDWDEDAINEEVERIRGEQPENLNAPLSASSSDATPIEGTQPPSDRTQRILEGLRGNGSNPTQQ